MNKYKLNQGLAPLAIVGIIAAVIIVAAGGYFLLKGGSSSNSTISSQPINNQSAPVTSQTTATPSTPSSVGSVGDACSYFTLAEANTNLSVTVMIQPQSNRPGDTLNDCVYVAANTGKVAPPTIASLVLSQSTLTIFNQYKSPAQQAAMKSAGIPVSYQTIEGIGDGAYFTNPYLNTEGHHITLDFIKGTTFVGMSVTAATSQTAQDEAEAIAKIIVQKLP
jgi:hypothetical protein